MKQVFVLFSICILLLASETILAQTGSDYYLPLSVGSHVKLSYTGAWAGRIATHTIEGTDLISGQQYFREVGRETGDPFSNVFEVFWLRKDSGGNVAIGAEDNTSTNIDSATVMSGYLFPNGFLTKGYSISYPSSKGVTGQQTVLSVSTGKVIYCEYEYSARGIGLVKVERTIPISQISTGELIEYSTTGVNDAVINIPQIFSLSQNYPNPFNPVTIISYQMPVRGKTELKVFDILGKEVAELVNEEKAAGTYQVKFDGSKLSSGVYFYQLHSGSFIQTKKLILMK